MNSTAIPPEAVAHTLAAADSLQNQTLAAQLAEQPRLVDLLWFIQWKSFQPGGLRAFTDELLTSFPDRIGTKTMGALGRGRGNRYTAEDCWKVWRDFNERYTCRWGERLDDHPGPVSDMSLQAFIAHHYWADVRELPRPCPEIIRQGVERFNWEFLNQHCREEAARCLPEFLTSLCERGGESAGLHSPWYCRDLINLLFAFMDQHAVRERARLAETEVVGRVFDALEYAWAEKKLVRINGNSRFGKTESLRTHAAMYPGRWRLVTVPCSNSEIDLVRAVAESLGITTSLGGSAPALRAKVEFIIKHCRLGFLWDESHFLIPIRYNRNTVPARLNWLRTQIVDRHLPCALLTTPQAYDGQSRRFQKVTSYNMDQWLGRENFTCDLPETLQQADLYAVARIHFPTLRKVALKMVVGAAQKSDGYLKAVESLASRARWLAAKRQARDISMDDVLAAIRDVSPNVDVPHLQKATAAALLTVAEEATAAPLTRQLGTHIDVESVEVAEEATAAPLTRPRRMTAAEATQTHRPGRRTAVPESDPARPTDPLQVDADEPVDSGPEGCADARFTPELSHQTGQPSRVRTGQLAPA